MEKRFNNLEGLHIYMRALIDQLTRKDIKNIPSDIVLEFMVASQTYMEEETLEFTKELGYFESHPHLRVLVYQPYYARNVARCWHTRDLIEYNLDYILRNNLWGIRATIIHELCHLSIHGHPIEFYELQLSYLKKVGMFDKDLPFEDAFRKGAYSGRYYIVNPQDIPESQKDYEKLTIYSNKVDEFFRHPVYDLSIRCCGRRYISNLFRGKIEELCNLYNTKIKNFHFS